MSKMQRNKGQRGEREVAKLIQPVVDEVYGMVGEPPPSVERNLMQTAKGGYDLVGLDWLAIEIKRQETLNVNGWWKQTLAQAGEEQTPVLLYRKNRQPWRVVTLVWLGERQIRAEIGFEDWLAWLYEALQAACKPRSGAGL